MDTGKLIERAKAGDARALRTIYETYSQRMRNVCTRITQEDEDTVSDLVQESFIRAYYSLGKLKDASKLGEWIVAITKNVSLRYLERKQKVQVVPFSSIVGDFDVESPFQSDSEINEKELLEIIDKLPSGYGKVFRMAVIDGYSHKEIAEALGIEPHSSSSQLTRARALLRSMIGKHTLALVSIIIICIPICKYLFWKKEMEEEHLPTANVDDDKRKQPAGHVAVRQSPHSSISNENITAATTPNRMKLPHYALADTADIKSGVEENDSASNILIAIEKDTVPPDTTIQAVPKQKEFMADEAAPGHKGKWQLLAVGSLGSALAQNAYKMFIGNGSGDIDGPQPSGPETFSTWSEYYQYLQQNAHDGMSDEEKALMEIAFNNMNNADNIKNGGRIVEHEHHCKPMTFGLSVAMPLGHKWSLETGVKYSLLKSDFTIGEDSYCIKQHQKAHYLGIPLQATYRWFDAKHWAAYSSLGTALHIPVYGKCTKQYVTGLTTRGISSSRFTPSLQWAVGAGVGLQYGLAPNWCVYLEPTLSWYIPSGSAVHTIWTEHPFTITVPFGIRFTW